VEQIPHLRQAEHGWEAALKTILCYGDSNTWGMVPMTTLTSASRHTPSDRWPRVMQHKLGPAYAVIEEGLNGRTTVFDDPIDGSHKNGLTCFLPCLESHAPLDLVIIMLGSNDLKSRYGLTPYDIAAGAGRLVRVVSGDVRGQNGRKPEVLLVCPCQIGPLDLFSDVFAGGSAKSEQLSSHYRKVAETNGCHYLNAGNHVVSSSIDGLHMDVAGHHALGVAMAGKVRALFGVTGD
jgi:lysophospholipase L1-like esterase